jgi:hypothetical protein
MELSNHEFTKVRRFEAKPAAGNGGAGIYVRTAGGQLLKRQEFPMNIDVIEATEQANQEKRNIIELKCKG